MEGDGINLFTQINEDGPRFKNVFQLKVYNDNQPNLLIIYYSDGVKRLVWFDAEVPPRQWNTMCIVHSSSLNQLKILQNNNLVYSFKGKLIQFQ